MTSGVELLLEGPSGSNLNIGAVFIVYTFSFVSLYLFITLIQNLRRKR
jgi:hypothetical protein